MHPVASCQPRRGRRGPASLRRAPLPARASPGQRRGWGSARSTLPAAGYPDRRARGLLGGMRRRGERALGCCGLCTCPRAAAGTVRGAVPGATSVAASPSVRAPQLLVLPSEGAETRGGERLVPLRGEHPWDCGGPGGAAGVRAQGSGDLGRARAGPPGDRGDSRGRRAASASAPQPPCRRARPLGGAREPIPGWRRGRAPSPSRDPTPEAPSAAEGRGRRRAPRSAGG